MKAIFKPSILIFALLLLSTSLFSQTNAGPDQELCTNQTTLAADTPLTGFTGTWSVTNGACTITNPTLNTTQISNILSGINILRWTITDEIDTYYDDVIILNNSSTQAVAAADEEICLSTHSISANIFGSGETGLWTLINGSATISTPSVNISTVTNIASGINTFRWTIRKGICSTYDNLVLTNNQIFANAATDVTICENFYPLIADNPSPGTGKWSVLASAGSPIISNSNSYNTTVSALGTNTNSIKWNVVNGSCSAYDIIVITNHKPSTANAGFDQIACNNNAYLSANNPSVGTGVWTLVSGSGTINNINNYYTQVTNLNSGLNEFKWRITYNSCSSEDNVNINYDNFIVDAGPDDVSCFDTYTLNANNPTPGTGVWRVIGGTGTFSAPSTYNSQVSGMVSGPNTFEWKLTKGLCSKTDVVTITKNTPSTANAGPDKETCNGSALLAAVNPSVGIGSWSVVSGTGTFTNSLQNNATVTNVGLNSNTYRWTVNNLGCLSSDDVLVVNNSVIANAGIDQAVCVTSSGLNAIPAQTGETGIWQLLAGTSNIANVNLYNTGVSNLTPGLNKYKWTLTKGSCSHFDEVEVVNNQYAALAGISTNAEVCGDIATVIGNAPPIGGTGYWTAVTGTGIFDNSTAQTTDIRNLSLGDNIVRWNIYKSGCLTNDDTTIIRNSVFSDAGPNQDVCVTSATLHANILLGNDNGEWTRESGSGTITDPTNQTTTVIGLTSGVNTFRWTVNGKECVASDDVIINNNYFVTSAGIDQQICLQNTSLTATNPTPGTGYWSVVSGSGTFVSPSNYTTSVINIPDISTNIYRWNAFKNSCSAFDDISIQNNRVTADAGADFLVCTNQAALSGNNVSPGTGIWTVQVGTGVLADNTDANSSITGLSLNQNIFRWTVSHLTCVNYDLVTITNNSVTATAGADLAICENSINLSGEVPTGTETGLWEVVSGFGTIQTPTLYNTLVTNLSSGFSTLKWTIFDKGCDSDGDEMMINNKSFVADAGIDQNLTQFVTTTFMTASLPVGGTGTWIQLSGNGSIANLSNPTTQITNILSGTNKYEWTVNYNGCNSVDSVFITFLNFEAYAGLDKIICSDSLQLNARNDGGIPQVWTVVSGTGVFDDPYQPNTWVRNVSEGINIYRWTVSLTGATDSDEMSVNRLIAYAGNDLVVCADDFNMNGNPPGLNSTGQWDLIAGSGTIVSSTLYNTLVSNIGNLNNVFQWTISSNQCSISDYVVATKNIIIADAGIDQTVDESFTFLNAVLSGNATVAWSIISGSGIFNDNTDPFTQVTNLTPGDNVFRWTVSNINCSDFDDITITYNYVDPPSSIISISNLFEVYPNPTYGKFNIRKTNVEYYDIEIIDMFGKLIFKQSKINSDIESFDISNQTSGIYFISIIENNKSMILKIVKE